MAEGSPSRRRCDALIIAHRWYRPDGQVKVGGIDRIKEHLLARGAAVALLEHPLTTVPVDYPMPLDSSVSLVTGSGREVLYRGQVKPRSAPWRWIAEGITSPRIVTGCLEPGYTVFAADALCGLIGLKLRRAGQARKVVVHASDYSERRFGNPVVNALYQLAVKRNLQSADLVLCLSRRMLERFEVWYSEGRYLHFPTSPFCSECPRVPVKDRRRGDIVLLGVGAEGMKLEMLAEGVSRVLESRPDVRLHVIGGGVEAEAFHAMAQSKGVSAGSLIWHDFLEREKALAVTAKGGIGVAVYEEEGTTNYYRDSLKIREYAACGLPVVCDPSTGTAQEAKDAGAACLVNSADEFAAAIEKLIGDNDLYARMSRSALEWAEANDKGKLLEQVFAKLDSP